MQLQLSLIKDDDALMIALEIKPLINGKRWPSTCAKEVFRFRASPPIALELFSRGIFLGSLNIAIKSLNVERGE
jgi:hypothetical protein